MRDENWKKEFESIVRTIGSFTYGKERWFLQDNGLWYDRMDGNEIDIDELDRRITSVLKRIDEE